MTYLHFRFVLLLILSGCVTTTSPIYKEKFLSSSVVSCEDGSFIELYSRSELKIKLEKNSELLLRFYALHQNMLKFIRKDKLAFKEQSFEEFKEEFIKKHQSHINKKGRLESYLRDKLDQYLLEMFGQGDEIEKYALFYQKRHSPLYGYLVVEKIDHQNLEVKKSPYTLEHVVTTKFKEESKTRLGVQMMALGYYWIRKTYKQNYLYQNYMNQRVKELFQKSFQAENTSIDTGYPEFPATFLRVKLSGLPERMGLKCKLKSANKS
jgi:hypothetical protein